MCHKSVFADALESNGIGHPNDLPLGVIVATCELTSLELIVGFTELPTDPEWSFGDYTVGRYMWHLEKIKRLSRPKPARGALGLWNWEN